MVLCGRFTQFNTNVKSSRFVKDERKKDLLYLFACKKLNIRAQQIDPSNLFESRRRTFVNCVAKIRDYW